MDKPEIGKIKKVPLREIWKKEDKNFTRWLEENIEYLNDVLDFDLSIISREEKVGPFKVDLFAEDINSKRVIIENQLEKTDHDHLGKLITYLVNLEAKTAIWITSKPTDEHEKAIEWLNEVTPDDIAFYLIKIEAIRIGGQPKVGPLFTIVKGPSKEAKELGEEKKLDARRHVFRKEFWTKLLEMAKSKTDLHSNVSPNIYSWIGTGSGVGGIGYNYSVTKNTSACEIYLDKGKEFEEPNINEERFDKLIKHKSEIEKNFGGELNWERLDGRRACRISIKFKGGYLDKDKWDSIHEKMLDAMIRLEKTFKPYIRELK